MENQNNIGYSDLEVSAPVGSSKKSNNIKKLIEIYTKRFGRIPTRIKESSGPQLNTRNYTEKLENVDENIITPSYSTETPHIEKNNIAKSHLLKNQSHTKKFSSDDTQVRCPNSNHEDTGETEDSDKKLMKDCVTRVEKYIYDFDKAYVGLKTPKRDVTNSVSELISPALNTDKENNPEEIIGSTMSQNVDETIKFKTQKKIDREQDEKDASEEDSTCILSDNCLLEKAVEQLRIEFKQFFDEFDMKTDTFKTAKSDQNHIQLLSKKVSKHSENKTNITSGRIQMSVLDIIEDSRQSRTKYLRSLKSSNSNLPLEITKRHFDKDGFCMRSNEETRKSVDVQKLKSRGKNFTRLFSRTDQINDFIPTTEKAESSYLRKITTKSPLYQENKRDGVPDSNQSSCKATKQVSSKVAQGRGNSKLPILKKDPSMSEIPRKDNHKRNESCARGGSTKIIEGKGSVTSKKFIPPFLAFRLKKEDRINRTNRKNQVMENSNPSTNNKDFIENHEMSDGLKTSRIRNIEEKPTGKDSPKLDQTIADNLSSSPEISLDCHNVTISNEVLLENNKSIEKAIWKTYIKSSHKNTSNNSEDIDKLHESNRAEQTEQSEIKPNVETAKHVLLSEGQSQMMYSLPVGTDEFTIDPSITISNGVCNNLQSTCIYFNKNRGVTDLVAVLIPAERDLKDELERLGGYEKFENVLLHNTRLTSETNQTV